MKGLIFAGNLHFGGAVQVATSFISELASLDQHDKFKVDSLDVVVSSVINHELVKLNINIAVFNNYKVSDYFGLKNNKKSIINKNYDVCFVIFGPIYYSLNADKYVVGFAQPWIAYSDNDVYKKLSLLDYLKNKCKFLIQDFLFRRYEHLLVEHEHVKMALVAKGYKNKISVISNTYSSVFDRPEIWQPIIFPKIKCSGPKLGFIGRAYTHKNLSVLKKVDSILRERFNLSVNFIFTLDASEMADLGFDKYENFYTTGVISSTQCPSFYQNLDALIFPTQLECFSIAPLEAMKMQKMVIASNYVFITKICLDAGFYFDSTDEGNIAEVIFKSLSDPDIMHEKIKVGLDITNNLPSARQRAIDYCEIIFSS